MIERKTNVEFITALMNHSRYGALIEAFVIEGLSNYAGQVVEAHDQGKLNTGMLVNADAWAGCAKEVRTKIDAHLKD